MLFFVLWCFDNYLTTTVLEFVNPLFFKVKLYTNIGLLQLRIDFKGLWNLFKRVLTPHLRWRSSASRSDEKRREPRTVDRCVNRYRSHILGREINIFLAGLDRRAVRRCAVLQRERESTHVSSGKYS